MRGFDGHPNALPMGALRIKADRRSQYQYNGENLISVLGSEKQMVWQQAMKLAIK
jgi:hypothetical protein